MDLLGILLGVLAVAVGAGLTMATAGHESFEFLIARCAFVMAAIAIEAAYFSWYRKAVPGLVTHCFVAAVAMTAAILAGPEAISWVNIREAEELKSTIPYEIWFTHRSTISVLLVAAAAVMGCWGRPQFWRIRHRLIFRWRHALAEEVWIDRASAIELVSKSRWATSRHGSRSGSLLTGLLGFPLAPDPHFRRFCELTLDTFARSNPQAMKKEDGQSRYDETKLRAYLAEAFDQDVTEKFGRPPSISV